MWQGSTLRAFGTNVQRQEQTRERRERRERQQRSRTSSFSVVRSRNFFYLCGVKADSLGRHIFTKVFFAFVQNRKCGSFQLQVDGTDFTHLLYSYRAMHNSCASIPYYPGVGYCIVYSCIGLSTTFDLVNENRLHTFFFYQINHIGVRVVLDGNLYNLKNLIL